MTTADKTPDAPDFITPGEGTFDLDSFPMVDRMRAIGNFLKAYGPIPGTKERTMCGCPTCNHLRLKEEAELKKSQAGGENPK